MIEIKVDLGIVYILGVVVVFFVIYEKKECVYELMIKKNIVVVISDGLVVLGLGNIGFEAVMFVMEGKAVLFKCFVGVDLIFFVLDI